MPVYAVVVCLVAKSRGLLMLLMRSLFARLLTLFGRCLLKACAGAYARTHTQNIETIETAYPYPEGLTGVSIGFVDPIDPFFLIVCTPDHSLEAFFFLLWIGSEWKWRTAKGGRIGRVHIRAREGELEKERESESDQKET